MIFNVWHNHCLYNTKKILILWVGASVKNQKNLLKVALLLCFLLINNMSVAETLSFNTTRNGSYEFTGELNNTTEFQSSYTLDNPEFILTLQELGVVTYTGTNFVTDYISFFFGPANVYNKNDLLFGGASNGTVDFVVSNEVGDVSTGSFIGMTDIVTDGFFTIDRNIGDTIDDSLSLSADNTDASRGVVSTTTIEVRTTGKIDFAATFNRGIGDIILEIGPPFPPGQYGLSYRERITDAYEAAITSNVSRIFNFLDDSQEFLSAPIFSRQDFQERNTSREESRRLLFGRPGRGFIGSLGFRGTTIVTDVPDAGFVSGAITYQITLGQGDTLSVPFAFGDNINNARLLVVLNSETVAELSGSDFEKNFLNVIDLDISGLSSGSTNFLEFVLISTDFNSAEVFIPEGFDSTAQASADENSLILRDTNLSFLLTQKLIDASQNTRDESRAVLVPSAGNQRASVEFIGNTVFSATTGILSQEISLGTGNTLSLPFAFGENRTEATLEIFLNNDLVATLNGRDYEKNVLNVIDIDITGVGNSISELQFVLNTNPIIPTIADVFIPDAFGFSITTRVENDFTGDDKADILIRNQITGQWRLNPVDGRFVQFDSNFGTVGITTDLTLQNQDISDFTGDGLADVLLRNANTGEWVLNELNGKTVVNTTISEDLPTDLNWQFVAAEDFTGDGISDVVLRHVVDGTWRLYPMDVRNVPQDSNFDSIAITPNLDWQPVAASDFNGDGFSDIVLRNQVSGLWLMIPMQGRTVLRDEDFGGIGITQDLAWEVAGGRDFTGDGRADLLLRHNFRGQWLLLPLDGKQVDRGENFGGVRFLATTLDWQPALINDFTGDGIADVLIRNNVTGAWRMHPMNGKTVVRDDNFGGVAVTPELSWELQ